MFSQTKIKIRMELHEHKMRNERHTNVQKTNQKTIVTGCGSYLNNRISILKFIRLTNFTSCSCKTEQTVMFIFYVKNTNTGISIFHSYRICPIYIICPIYLI